MRLSSKLVLISLPLLLILSGAAVADTCNAFSSYTCANHTSNIVHVGPGTSNGAYVLLNSNLFDITTANGNGGSDVIVLAAFVNVAPQGTLNGISFTSVLQFPEGKNTNVLTNDLLQAGFCKSGSACNLSFGFVDLGTALAANGSVSVTASGIPNGTIFYAEVLNSNGQIVYITPNSEAGILDHGTSTVPEPGSLSLLVTGLCGIAGGAWRKLRG
jgi:hypothetical protein